MYKILDMYICAPCAQKLLFIELSTLILNMGKVGGLYDMQY